MTPAEKKYIDKPAACTSPPWAVHIPPRQKQEVLRQIRQECLDAYGMSLDECPKRLTCISKSCIGRPLPWKAPTALPYLEKLLETHSTKFNEESGEEELLIASDCRGCPFFSKCEKECNQVLDSMDRFKVVEPTLEYSEIDPNIPSTTEIYDSPSAIKMNAEDIPWDVLGERRAKIIHTYVYVVRDFRSIAHKLGMYNQAPVKYDFYAALTTLSKYAVMREFLKHNKNKLTPTQKEILELVFEQNLTNTKASEKLKVSKQAIQQVIARVIKKHKIKWKAYVKKITVDGKTKTKYNLSEGITW